MARPFAVHGKSVQLTGKPNRKIADLAHLLYFAKAFLQTFAHFITHQFAT